MIEKISQDTLKLKLEDGSVKDIPKTNLKCINYGYCVTIYAAQGKAYENTIAAISTNKWLNNQKSWLVTLSRHKTEFTALVENKSMLETNLMENTRTEISAIELVSKMSVGKEISSREIHRPHKSLDYLTPCQYLANLSETYSLKRNL